ncbi:FAD-binding oxidoreductase [Oharaeibacter diazotrophicus]|uniref:D-lactate dehydrogenase (cytochrome) n=1 Tax=Oharaeibacter diazotrophicus TaxID=1920512 RepID=A0A4V3CWA5_9HYPH|nr:FAD-linked oxidase C-terminal domain-containing protein [Oharaeibacter diazotrophicus]TDP85568.1 D-lactate dehydrogenase (cytochrome) [Oharaeibacter diazotrophicus]BBE74539.1 putative FAD-linked oxidoreductase [Pleomorphomonas sp. SM30]GLS75762.1 lactate dehydrogenase [Oharaeibacter diazotrophicus]
MGSGIIAVERNEAGIAAAVDALAARFGDRFSRAMAVRLQHGHTTSRIPNQPPDGVVFATSTAEVAETVRICAAHRVPVIPFGTGTSLEGHVNAPGGGISIDLSRMDRIVAVNPEDLDCTVEAGVTRKRLNEHLRDTGLFFPVDPGADASIGGMTSTRASGTNAVRYGTMKDLVLALTVVTASGEIVHTGSRAKKSSAGYDLTRLFVGAEGTLGVVTEITLKLFGIPEEIAAGVCTFPTVRAACETVIATIQSAIPVARIELLDTLQVHAVNNYSKLGLVEAPTLFLEFHGTPEGVAEQARRFGAIAADFGGTGFTFATRPEERTRLWQARHDVYWSCNALRPGWVGMATDVCVPISRLADLVDETIADVERHGLVAPIVGHVGDGNFHLQPMIDPDDPAMDAAVDGVVERLALRAIEMGGTCTGEHGVGQGKTQYLDREHGGAMALMRAIKAALDPDGIMNPGKIFAMPKPVAAEEPGP